MSLSRFFFLTGLSNLGTSFVYAFTGAQSISANTFLFAVLFACALPLVIAGAFKPV